MNPLNQEKEKITIQIIMDALRKLLPLERIISAAHFADSFDTNNLSLILDLSPDFINQEINKIQHLINYEIKKYESDHNLSLYNANEYTIKEAFIQIFSKLEFLQKLEYKDY